MWKHPAIRHRRLLTHTCAAFAICIALLASPAFASSVMPMSLPQLADHTGQAFVGTVASVRSYWTGDPKRIESQVTFQQVEYLKGKLPDASDTFELTVPGGEVDGIGMRVTDAPVFEPGQKWILLILPTYRTFPVSGLYQGAFRVVLDKAGKERIATGPHNHLQQVLAIDDSGFIQMRSEHQLQAADHLRESDGVTLAPDTTLPRQAMSLDAFVAQLRPILNASKQHSLTEAAGRRIVESARAVPLKLSAYELQRRGADPPEEPAANLRANGAQPELQPADSNSEGGRP